MAFLTQVLDRPHGRLFVLSPEAARFAEKPLILLLHGAFEKHKKLLPWADLWAADYDVALADLPGHGQSDATPNITFDAYIEELRWMITGPFGGRRVVVVGDSFGGLLGIALGNQPPSNLAAVIALDPLLSTAKQWSIQDLIPRILEGQAEDGFRRRFADTIMGMREGETEDRDYRFYIEGAQVPVLIITGAEALGERRDVAGPSLLDADDRQFLETRVPVRVVPGVGHQLVLQRPQETLEFARIFVRALD